MWLTKDKVIISGGQTGVDQAALEVAHSLGVKTDGYAPKGYITEVGVQKDLLLGKYGLREHASSYYSPRTRDNVKMADGVLLFGRLSSPGSALTKKLCDPKELNKPFLDNPKTVEEVLAWLKEHKIFKLMVAGNRLSVNPEAAERCTEVLLAVFSKDPVEQNIVVAREAFEAGFLAGFQHTDNEWNGEIDEDGNIRSDSRFALQSNLAWETYRNKLTK